MKKLKQLVMLLQMSLSGIPQRLPSVLVTVTGITCVVGVLVAMLAMGVSARSVALKGTREDRISVSLKPGASFDRASLEALMDMPGIRKDAGGKPITSPEVMVQAVVHKKIDNARNTIFLMGVNQQYFKVYPELRLTKGRLFQPAVRELMVGKIRREQSTGLEIGDKLHLRGVEWTIVGEYDLGGAGVENGMVGDIETIKSAYQLNTASFVTALVDTPAGFATLQKAVQANPMLNIELQTEVETAKKRSKRLSSILDFISYFVGAVMAIGATLSAINVMYSMVDSRKREMATLRAIGFTNGPIVFSLMIESLLLALPGAVLGVLLAWVFFNGSTVSPMGVSFKLMVTPGLAAVGIGWAVFMGLVGGLLPSIRAARIQVATALRAV